MVLAAQVCVAWFAYLWLVFESLSVAGCEDRCDLAAVAGALSAQMWVGIGTLVVAAVGIVALTVRERESWWMPTVGVAVIIMTCVINSLVIDAAITI